MSKILVVGARPLPFENSNSLFALGLRTRHLVKSLVDDGHQVYLFAGTIPPSKEKFDKRDTKTIQGNFMYHAIFDIELFFDKSFLQSIHDTFSPDCILGINTLPASVAAGLSTTKPLWLDLHGALMTEAQGRSHLIGNNEPVKEFWEQEKICLEKGDIFSTVSTPQKYMLLGELAAMKRLNQYTLGYEFAYSIPASVENIDITHKKTVLRGKKVDDKDFVILWSGGYNTWTDTNFLYNGLVSMMAKYPQLKFVSTGGAIPLHNEITYQNFIEKINQSPCKNQFVLLGWVPTEDVYDYYFESNIGINIDTLNYDTLTGTRTRLLHMLKTGLPVVTTLGTEISQVVQEHQLGLTSPIGNLNEFRAQLEFAITYPDKMKEMGQTGRQYVKENYTFEKTSKPLREWVRNPKPAPDKAFRKKSQESIPERSQTPIGQAMGFYRKLIKRVF